MTDRSNDTLWTPRRALALTVLLLVWFAAAAVIGVGELMVNTAGSPMAPIAVTALAPPALFLALYRLSPTVRRFVLAQDIRTLTMLHHWRVVGFGFLLLYSHGVLPGLFAWPAGLGDVLIGLAAPLVVLRLTRDPSYAASPGLVRFHLLGLTDFAVAVLSAGLTAGAWPALTADGLTSAPMDVWPLNLFPSFIVPAFIILHLAVLLKVREMRRVPNGAVPAMA